MMSLLVANTRIRSAEPVSVAAGDLIRRLGDISPERIRLKPTPGQATISDLERPENKRCELVDGTLVEKAMGWHESFLAGYVISLIWKQLEQTNLGIVTAPDGLFQLNPKLARAPDVAFIPWSRLPSHDQKTSAVPAIIPALAVEILSASNTNKEMNRKREEYFEAGVLLVWEIDPKSRSAKSYTSIDHVVEHDEFGKLDGGTVLPGFLLSLEELFAKLDQLP